MQPQTEISYSNPSLFRLWTWSFSDSKDLQQAFQQDLTHWWKHPYAKVQGWIIPQNSDVKQIGVRDGIAITRVRSAWIGEFPAELEQEGVS